MVRFKYYTDKLIYIHFCYLKAEQKSITMNSKPTILLNTSNKDKLAEYNLYLDDKYEVVASQKDLDEPEADPITIMRYKASQFQNVLVDDVSFDVLQKSESDSVISPGSNIRWALANLKNPEYHGKSAVFSCLLGIRRDDKVYIFSGQVHGKIVAPKGDGFGFGPCFLPDGLEKTLGEYMDPHYNARYIAIQNFINDKPEAILDPLETWSGPFQHSN